MSQNNNNNQDIEEDPSQKSYVRLSFEGQQKYKDLQGDSVKGFLFWAFVGNIGGFAVSSFIPYLPFKDPNKHKIKRYQRYTFFTSLIAFSYHGYKLTKRDFLRGKKKLLQNPQYIVTEPEDFSDQQ